MGLLPPKPEAGRIAKLGIIGRQLSCGGDEEAEDRILLLHGAVCLHQQLAHEATLAVVLIGAGTRDVRGGQHTPAIGHGVGQLLQRRHYATVAHDDFIALLAVFFAKVEVDEGLWVGKRAFPQVACLEAHAHLLLRLLGLEGERGHHLVQYQVGVVREFCLAQSLESEVLLSIYIYDVLGQARHKLIIYHCVGSFVGGVGLFYAHVEGLAVDSRAEGEGHHLALHP